MNIVIENMWVIAPVALLDVPMRTAKFYKGEGAKADVTSYFTVREYCEQTTAQWRESNDGRYMCFGHELSDLYNDLGTAKSFATEQGLTLGGDDFTQTGDGLVWILNWSEARRFLETNPMFASEQDELAG